MNKVKSAQTERFLFYWVKVRTTFFDLGKLLEIVRLDLWILLYLLSVRCTFMDTCVISL